MQLDKTTQINFRRHKKPRRTVGIIPLIDIAFFLLIFFMVAGSMEQFEILDIEPPIAHSGDMLEEGDITILLGTHDEIIMDDLLLTSEQLDERLQQKFLNHEKAVVTIKADASIAALRLVEVMDLIKQAGGMDITIATESSND